MIRVITGPPCAGKTTYMREHAKDGDLRVDYDLIAQALGSANSHTAEGLIREAAFGAREGAIEAALKDADSDSWIIHTSPSEEHRKRYEEAGAEFIALDPGYDVCMERAKQDCRPQQTIDGIEKWYSGKKGRRKGMKYKTIAFKNDDSGKISGYFSTYDEEPDSYGEIVAPGAFTDTIKAREATGHPFPLCFNHNMDIVIGKVDDIEDTDKGPLFTASFFDTQKAQEVRAIVKSGAVYQFSFAYEIREASTPTEEQKAKGIMQVLTKVDLLEVSVVVVPANQNAVVTDIKSGRRNSKKDADAIRQAITLLQGVLDAEDQEGGEDDPKGNARAEDPKESNPAKKDLLEYIKKI